jgi:hypothetical protein
MNLEKLIKEVITEDAQLISDVLGMQLSLDNKIEIKQEPEYLSSNIHPAAAFLYSYREIKKGLIDLSPRRAIIPETMRVEFYVKNIYRTVWAIKWVPFLGTSMVKRYIRFLLAHELRHWWQLTSLEYEPSFFDQYVSYENRKEEHDANNFASKYVRGLYRKGEDKR